MIRKKRHKIMLFFSFAFLFSLGVTNARAAPVLKTDSTGAVTGVVGDKYYDVSSWKDMTDAYQSAPNDGIARSKTLVLNAVGNVSYGTFSPTLMEQNVVLLGNGKTF
ncbi:MAG: hypothetical protein LBD38_03410, partial [Streptococcaceae bacterium]|nr:hypothetical protein [Streptococcaceae bacterium]